MSPSTSSEIRETNRIFEEEVVYKRDFSALARVYTRDARVLPPGAEMITGLGHIQAFWEQTAAALEVVAVQLRTVDIEFLGDTAIEIGRATLTTAQAPPGDVKYVVIWKREDEIWKWHIDIWNAVS